MNLNRQKNQQSTQVTDTTNEYIPSFDEYRRVCYYPSSWHTQISRIFLLDCDLFVLSEQRRFPFSVITQKYKRDSRSQLTLLHSSDKHLCFQIAHETRPLKTCWIFFERNRDTVRRLQVADMHLDYFLGINDGCREGGNSECVHDAPFISLVLPLMKHNARYITDHGNDLQASTSSHYDYTYHSVRRKYRDYVYWSECQGIKLALNAVLVYASDDDHNSLYVLPFGMAQESELMLLRAFRTREGRDILAEFRVLRGIQYSERL